MNLRNSLYTTLSALLALCILSGCNVKEELEGYEILDRVRILALQSEPPDLLAGESATLSAFVYNPEDEEMSYQWSWCPVRNGPQEGFSCAMEEETLKEVWTALGRDEELPSYDLGNEASAEFKNVFDGKAIFEICAILLEEGDVDDLALLSCVMGLQISVELRMSKGDQEWVALKNLELLLDEKENERNSNPSIQTEMKGIKLIIPRNKLKPLKEPVEAGAPLYEGSRYEFIVDVNEDQSESFTPEKLEGVDDAEIPDEKKENLFLKWFVTKDAVDSGVGGSLFVDGSIDFEDFLTNEVSIAPTVKSGNLGIYLVIRDERGGVGWMSYEFDVEAGQ